MRRACLALGLVALAGSSAAQTPPREIAFAIAAQPLDQALAQYSLASGLTVLVDSALTAGRDAPAVVGTYTPGDALRRLLAGSPLAIRYASPHSFTLVAAPAPAAQPARTARLRDTPYAAALQGALKRALCKGQGAAPGSYRALVKLWFDKAWRVNQVDWVSGTGSAPLNQRLEAALRGVTAGPLPAGMPQPVTVLLQPGSAQDCQALQGDGRAG
ncbi:STN domain-containing protein [Achromobacter sp. UMC71]|uniref:STN domain-containing protein n=1 Tax=Achromobacter sp. UMC71 TaxID=1862320 RepID=UPI00160365AC|nr:STN domain-containing protein [Achromobacter sp. UMC71]MBB1627747.1 energy transducer TonB [Achromobacter sp. UMC71]